jgi:hypothetical protein
MYFYCVLSTGVLCYSFLKPRILCVVLPVNCLCFLDQWIVFPSICQAYICIRVKFKLTADKVHKKTASLLIKRILSWRKEKSLLLFLLKKTTLRELLLGETEMHICYKP